MRPEAISARGLFDAATVAGLISAHRANREDYTDVLLALANFEIWACMYIDGRSHEDVTGELKAVIR